ncbi:hypothetical protein FJT64_003210 [Amphibalanus amphitrite]|uniref:DUF7041 domain-containing protein n=1 Tax=Amphibalanus amphitrite TaxID=1232801 RepID=A0A6A4WAW9_AMPAM|nr:hypothetical protein FJT64_003210 [Amphibalanus amphitrite]
MDGKTQPGITGSTADAAAAVAAAAAAAQPEYLCMPAVSRNHVAPARSFEEDPVIWLVQFDLFFSQAAVDDELSRFRIAATLLPGHLLRDFTDIRRNPPADRPYTILSDAIRQRFGKSVEQRLRCLLSSQQLGDRRPSKFLRHLLDLAEAEGSQDSPLILQIFLNALPPRIQPFLQCLPPGTDLATIASTADRLLELPQQSDVANPSSGFLAAVSTSAPAAASPATSAGPFNLQDLMSQLLTGITALTTTVATLVDKTCRRERSASRAPGRARHRSPRDLSATARSPSPGTNTSTGVGTSYCWYHQKFGTNARSCPCSWSATANQNSGNQQ